MVFVRQLDILMNLMCRFVISLRTCCMCIEICKEWNSIYGDELETHQSLHCSVVANHQALLRMKRCALTYLYVY